MSWFVEVCRNHYLSAHFPSVSGQAEGWRRQWECSGWSRMAFVEESVSTIRVFNDLRTSGSMHWGNWRIHVHQEKSAFVSRSGPCRVRRKRGRLASNVSYPELTRRSAFRHAPMVRNDDSRSSEDGSLPLCSGENRKSVRTSIWRGFELFLKALGFRRPYVFLLDKPFVFNIPNGPNAFVFDNQGILGISGHRRALENS